MAEEELSQGAWARGPSRGVRRWLVAKGSEVQWPPKATGIKGPELLPGPGRRQSAGETSQRHFLLSLSGKGKNNTKRIHCQGKRKRTLAHKPLSDIPGA